MGFKTVVVHVSVSAGTERRVRLAAQIVRMSKGRLVGAAMSGISRFLYADHATAMGVGIAAQCIDEARESARASLRRFESQCAMLDLPSYEARLLDDRAADGLVLQSRYADLVVLGQANPGEPIAPLEEETPEFVAMNSARPVLVLPYAGHFEAPFRRILVAWDGSMEATRAITAAIPLLREAAKVTLAVFNAGRQADAHGSEPGADMALYLARHGIKVEVASQVTEIDIGSALLSFAADVDADLLVMGCYGHSRFREIMLGGATRTVLESMTLPVLMAH
ncbi:universal stress protein [Pseudoduganella violaceinigra]|uniref:universal stress protein n=1 Tax=Pseudoduganella violaceinigra TaxID=246602 RepID=UPI00042453E2|nr:universal stress protein [Pseudoduganella violaceinigra]